MANLEVQPGWPAVRQLENEELAWGGVNGNMNEQAKALAARTEFLNQEKASKSEIVQGVFEFGTYAEFDAAKATLPLNCTVVIGEENITGTGNWGIGNNTWNGTILKKSSFDPVETAKKYSNSNPIFKPVDLVGTEVITDLPNGRYYVSSSTIANLLGDQLPADMTVPKVGTIEINNRNSVIREIEFSRYTKNANGEREVFTKVSTGSGALAWLPWEKEVSRFEFDALKAASPLVNLFKTPNFETEGSTRFQGTVSQEDGSYILSIASTPDNASVMYDYIVDGSLIAKNKSVTFSADAMSDVIGAGAAGTDISVVAYDSAGTSLLTVTARNTKINEWQNISVTMVVPSNAEKLSLRFIRRVNCTYAKYRNPFLLSNTLAAKTITKTPMIGVGHLNTYISETGSDTTGDGSISNPFKTAVKAQSVMSGVGDLIIKAGTYDGLQINAAKAKDMMVAALSDASLGRAKIRYGTKLTGIINVSGKVFKASIALTGQQNAIWQEGVPDTRTLVPPSEIHFGLRGRTHRLEHTKIEKTTATTRIAAIAEIESASDPRCFYDIAAGEILFSVANGTNALTANIYVPITGGSQTLFTGRTSLYLPPATKIRLVGLDLLYGSINNIGASLATDVEDCRVIGPAANAYDLAGNISLKNNEAAGYGSGITSNGDGFNFHNYAIVDHKYLYMHDGYDDGISSHENCFETGYGAVSEYNGGGGYTPAYGSQAKYGSCLSRKNNGVTSRFNTGKTFGFESHAANTGGGDDISTLTSMELDGCISIGDKNGIGDMWYWTGANSYAKAKDCTVIDTLGIAFGCHQVLGTATHIGTGITIAPERNGRNVDISWANVSHINS